MINKLFRTKFRSSSKEATVRDTSGITGELPCIGRKSDLIPVDSQILGIVQLRPGPSSNYEKIADQVREVLQYDRLAITVLDFDQDTFRNIYVSGRPLKGIEPGDTFPLSGSFIYQAARSRHAAQINGYSEYPDQQAFVDSGLLSRIATSLILDGEVIGTLHLASTKAGAYRKKDLIKLEQIGNQVAGVIYNSTLLQAEKDRSSQLEALYSVAALLAQPQTFETKAQGIVETLVRIANADQAIVRRADDLGERLDLVATAGTDSIRFEPALSISDQDSASSGAFRDGRVLLINDYQSSPDAMASMQAQGVGSVIVLPIVSGGRSLGILSVTSMKANHFDHERVSLIKAFADGIGTVFDTADLADDLQASAARAQAVMDTAADAIITINQMGLIETFNLAAEFIFGYSAEEAVGQNVSLLMPEPDKGDHDGFLARYLATGEHRIIGIGRELVGRRKDGTVFPMDLSVGVAEIGETKVYTGIVRDITERKKAEARLNESNRLASVGVLAAGVAHEINNPLAAIILASDFLSQSGLSDEAAADVKVINDSAQRAARIVQDMLLFARKSEPKPERITLESVVLQALEMKSHDFRVKNIQTRLEVESEAPYCLIDKHLIGQVIVNLLNNAEYALVSHRGGGHITIDIHSEPGSVVLEVRDDGPGIESDLLLRIFEPFFTTKPAAEGTGLGLSICHGIVEQHSGRLWATNNASRGATFHMQLPISDGEPQSDSRLSPQSDDADISKTRLLIVDDEETLSNVLKRGLQMDFDVVDQASNGEAAWEMIGRTDYDCILLDLRMPGLSGMELFERIAASDHQLSDRIIFMTGDTARPESAAFLAGIENPVIGKPFQMDLLKREISLLIARFPDR